ncbi:DUF599 domain-containing protein [Chthonobacter albigriseus]|uniref:DUF599 domain-containing protein n=1 Tax=Chthonobacter albigriseus TaxID=1683161 RepID=UPI0015EF2E1F|nr:DUF599 family protein [Chthonobacter albigriseus]
MSSFTTLDLIAVGWFLGVWLFLSWLTEFSPFRTFSLTFSMNGARRDWIERMAERELRMIDTSIMAGLQNGTAFFASTSLLAIGGCFALLNSTDRVIEVFQELPYVVAVSRGIYEAKVLGLIVIYAYAFFKFGWAYRVFNYASILIGAVPMRDKAGTAEMRRAVDRAATMTVLAGRHFNRGLRAFFMSIGYLGWFLGPVPLVAGASFVFIVLIRRQFFSDSRAAVTEPQE